MASSVVLDPRRGERLQRPAGGALVYDYLPAEPGAPLVLMLHGLNSNERDLMGLAPLLDARLALASARAPNQLGPDAFAWFAVRFDPRGSVIDVAQERASRQRLELFIGELRARYKPAALYVLGFSQGGIMALSLALTRPGLTDGAVVLSARLLPEVLAELPPRPWPVRVPVFLGHGLQDTVIPVQQARRARDALAELPVELAYREYVLGHGIAAETVEHINQWLDGRLPRSAQSAGSASPGGVE